MARAPKITFGIIVLNGEPFTRYNLRALYPFAHEIIVVEGASPNAAHAATPDGHSIDGTLAVLRQFKRDEDPADKLRIVTAEDDGHPSGFWPGEKDQQSQAYARRATGDWLWQIDIDEFYDPADMQRVCAYLQARPEMTCLTFYAYHFWGGFDYLVEGGLFRHRLFQGEPWGAYRRLFRWGPGYAYLTHRPPTVADSRGQDSTLRQLRNANWIWPRRPVRMYHYLMLFPEQFLRKGAYYEKQSWSWDRGRLKKNQDLLHEVGLHNGLAIYDHHGTRNWLRRFTGAHPPQVQALRADLAAGRVSATLRHNDDIERLLADPRYQRMVRRAAVSERLRAYRDHLIFFGWYLPRHRIARMVRQHLPSPLKAHLPLWLRTRLDADNR